ncbi:MAG TPA: extracellular solute-binding protein, partial [Spirochaetia bacterium]|nr:extracellular solute-binding protein [Spirochaetia bacterium]
AKLQAEMQANDVKADVIWFADIAYFHKLASEGKLLAANVTAKDVPAEFKYEGGKYWEVRQIFNVVAYNTEKVKTPPTSWMVLADPKYKGKVGMPSPAYSGGAFTGLATLTQTPGLGWQFYKDLAKNDTVVEQANGAIANKLASGEFEVGTVVGFMIRNLKEKGSPVNYVWPKEGAVLIPTPVGVLSSTKHPNSATKLIDYMLSDRGQKLFVKQGYIPVRPGMGVPPGVPDLSSLHVLQVNVDYMNNNHDQLMSEFQKLFP